MSTRNYTTVGKRARGNVRTPQSQPIAGSTQVPNNAGGYGWAVDPMTQLQRFLILGTTEGTYYVDEEKLTLQNVAAVDELLRTGRGQEVIDLVVEISEAGRAARNNAAIFVLAQCMACNAHAGEPLVHAARVKTIACKSSETMPTFPVDGKNAPKRHLREGESWQAKTGKKARYTRHGLTITVERPERSHTVIGADARRMIPHPMDVAVRSAARRVAYRVARTPVHLMALNEYCEQFRGRGPVVNRVVRDRYEKTNAEKLAYWAVKYQARTVAEGDKRAGVQPVRWSQRDMLRLTHPHPGDADHQDVFHWITKGETSAEPHSDEEGAMRQIYAWEAANVATEEREIVRLIRDYRLPREAVPTQFLRSPAVWKALLVAMPMEAMLRNVATMTRNGTFAPFSDALMLAVLRLTEAQRVRESRLHPMKILSALRVYDQGKSIRGDVTWTPLREVRDALNEAFYLSFANIVPSGKRILLAVDVSGSMWENTVNSVIEREYAQRKEGKQFHNPFPAMTAAEGAAAMAMVIARSEPATHWHVIGFESDVYPLPLSPVQRMDEVVRTLRAVSHPHGTNCALPYEYAQSQHMDVDAVITISDSESWQGDRHACEALTAYRRHVGHPVAAVSVQMTATHVTLLDPSDTHCLEVVGFDTAAPATIADFLRGSVQE